MAPATLNPRDALNSLLPTMRSHARAATWQGAMNAANGGPSSPMTPGTFDLNAARSTPAAPAEGGDLPATPGSFRAALSAIAAAPKSNAAPTAEDEKLRKTAEVLVNKMFMGTMLKRMRSSPFKDPTFSGGKAGEAYAGLFDQRIAENAGGGMADKLVGSLVKKFKSAGATPPPSELLVDPRRRLNNARSASLNRANDDAATVRITA